jgi:hypothetical protein
METGHLIVDRGPPERARLLPFKIVPAQKAGEVDLAGDQHVVAVDGGYLVGFDAGEFGGGVWWFSGDGTQRRKLTLRATESVADYFPENVHEFAFLAQDVLVFEGLTHMGSNSGRVVRIHLGSDGDWQPSVFAELSACPHAAVQESTSSWLIATTAGVWRVDTQARVRPIWQPAGGHLYYPNSIARDGAGVVYMGMRRFVLRMTPRQAGDYAVQVLEPPSQ